VKSSVNKSLSPFSIKTPEEISSFLILFNVSGKDDRQYLFAIEPFNMIILPFSK